MQNFSLHVHHITHSFNDFKGQKERKKTIINRVPNTTYEVLKKKSRRHEQSIFTKFTKQQYVLTRISLAMECPLPPMCFCYCVSNYVEQKLEHWEHFILHCPGHCSRRFI